MHNIQTIFIGFIYEIVHWIGYWIETDAGSTHRVRLVIRHQMLLETVRETVDLLSEVSWLGSITRAVPLLVVLLVILLIVLPLLVVLLVVPLVLIVIFLVVLRLIPLVLALVVVVLVVVVFDVLVVSCVLPPSIAPLGNGALPAAFLLVVLLSASFPLTQAVIFAAVPPLVLLVLPLILVAPLNLLVSLVIVLPLLLAACTGLLAVSCVRVLPLVLLVAVLDLYDLGLFLLFLVFLGSSSVPLVLLVLVLPLSLLLVPGALGGRAGGFRFGFGFRCVQVGQGTATRNEVIAGCLRSP